MNQTLATAHVWTDAKRHLWWLGILPLATPLLSGALAITTGVQQLWWVGVVVIFGLIPLIDGLLGEDVSNPPESAVSNLESQRYYRWIVYTGVLFVIASVVITGWLAAGGIEWIINGGLLHATATLDPAGGLARTAAFITARTELHGEVSALTYLGMAMSTGAATGIAINTAHELGHKPKPLEVFLAKVTLAPTFYGHFYTEHNRGHHVRVATPEDPASSRLGESFWAFLPRSVWFSAVSAWNLERERLRKLGLPAWHWKNAVLSAWMYSVVLWGDDCLVGRGGDSVPDHSGCLRVLVAGSGQLRRALRA